MEKRPGLAIMIAQKIPKPKKKDPYEDSRMSDDEDETETDEEIGPGLESVAEELIAAVEAKDAKAVAEALRSAVEICG